MGGWAGPTDYSYTRGGDSSSNGGEPDSSPPFVPYLPTPGQGDGMVIEGSLNLVMVMVRWIGRAGPGVGGVPPGVGVPPIMAKAAVISSRKRPKLIVMSILCRYFVW